MLTMPSPGSAAAIFDALGDSTRRSLFERLSERPYAVNDLAAEMPISRPAVSQHLKVLKEAGLVKETPDGNRRIYRIDPHGIAAMRAWLDQHWIMALDAFQAVAEASARSGSSGKIASADQKE